LKTHPSDTTESNTLVFGWYKSLKNSANNIKKKQSFGWKKNQVNPTKVVSLNIIRSLRGACDVDVVPGGEAATAS